jgi:ribosomal protein S18 acetylase RimI-like enzyme
MTIIRAAENTDRAALLAVVAAQDNFTAEEKAVAEEVIDDGLTGRDDYRTLVAVDENGELAGFISFGPIPMTESSFDLYWIATLPALGRKGLGTQLLTAMEQELRGPGAAIYIDTSSTCGYDRARAFYEKNGYRVAARLKDFYHPGDDRLIYRKELWAAG